MAWNLTRASLLDKSVTIKALSFPIRECRLLLLPGCYVWDWRRQRQFVSDNEMKRSKSPVKACNQWSLCISSNGVPNQNEFDLSDPEPANPSRPNHPQTAWVRLTDYMDTKLLVQAHPVMGLYGPDPRTRDWVDISRPNITYLLLH